MTVTQATLVEGVAEIIHKTVESEFPAEPIETKPNQQWQMLCNTRTNLWLDTGDIDSADSLWCSNFQGLTTNNTLLNREIQKGIYDSFIPRWAEEIRHIDKHIDQHELSLELAFILNCVHALRLVRRFNCHVSVELHTDLANDVDRSTDYAMRYHRICPENFYIKIPLTPAGFIAARILENHNVAVNFTLGFSARQNYAAAVIANPHFVNVFLGRLNSFMAHNALGDGLNIGEKATLATQRNILNLRKHGLTTSHLIAASMRQSGQIHTLAGVDVMTMPAKVAKEYIENPGEHPVSNVMNDPHVEFAGDLTAEDIDADTLWQVPDYFKDTVHALLHKDIAHMRPQDIQEYFEDCGFEDLLPRWSEDQIATVTEDGKIPVFKRWEKKLTLGKIGLDALMNISALRSFATDQKALDKKVNSLIS